jgi:hypothetical protein
LPTQRHVISSKTFQMKLPLTGYNVV